MKVHGKEAELKKQYILEILFHVACKSCIQLLENIPQFNFFFLNTEKKKIVCGTYEENKVKPLVVELTPKDPEPTLD